MKELIGRKFPVDNQGWVMLTDYMGSDHSIAECARTSYGGNKGKSDDEHLINYMMRHGHTSPFEQAEIQFMVYVPMDTWRQWVRHRTASINEYSTRYSEAIDDVYEVVKWRYQDQNNRQGSCGLLEDEEVIEKLSYNEKHFHQLAKQLYKSRIRHGIAREQARKDLPLCTFTRAYWKIDLHNLFHFLQLRLAPEAQQEIRHYAEKIAEIVERLFPLSWAAFKMYRLNSLTFSERELKVIKVMLDSYGGIEGISNAAERFADDFNEKPDNLKGIIPDDWFNSGCRERNEFFSKIKKIVPDGFGFKEKEETD